MKRFLRIILTGLIILSIANPAWASWMYMKAGSTSQIIQIPIYDSSSTTGGMLTGLVYNSSGLTAYYNRAGASGAATSMTLVTATKGTWTSLGFVAVDGTNMPGWYELDIPDAALAAGANSVAIHLKGATNMVPVTIFIQLVANDGTNANVTQWNGTNVSSPATAGIPEVNVKNFNNTAVTARDIGASVLLSPGTGTGQISLASGAVTVGTNNDKTGYTASTVSDKTGYSLTQTFPTNFSALSISATTGLVDITQTAADKVWGTTTRALTSLTGFSLSAAGIDSIWDEVTTGHNTASSFGLLFITDLDAAISSRSTLTASDNIGINWADVSNPTSTVNLSGTNIKTDQVVASVSGAVGSVTGAVGSVTGAVGSVTGAVGSVTGGVTVTTNNDKTGYSLSSAGIQAIWDTLTSALTTVGSIGKKLADWVMTTIY